MKLKHVLSKRRIARILNMGLVAALLLSLLPAQVVSAAPKVAANVDPECNLATTTNNPLFLPFISLTGQQATAASVTASGAAAAPAGDDAALARQLSYQAGKTYRYDWKVVIDTKSTGRDNQGSIEQDGRQKTVIAGVVDVTITAVDGAGVANGQVTISDPFVCSTDGSTPSVLTGAEYDALAAALQKPLLFTQTAVGVVTAVSVPQDSLPLAINMQKGIVNALQANLREENAYQADEQGAQGAYSVQYAIEEKADGAHITKTYNESSFSALISAGDPTDRLKLNNQVTMVLNADGVFGSVASVEEMQSSDESQDPPSTEDAALDGVAAWSTTKSEGSLDLSAVVDASQSVLAASLLFTYRADSLGADISEQLPNPSGINLSQINLANEFATLEAEPTNPQHVLRMADIVFADDSAEQTVIVQIQDRMAQNSGNVDVVNAYIDVLTRVGSPAAQDVLSGILGNQQVSAASLSATLTITSQEHALISMVLLESPTITSVNSIQGVVGDEMSPLGDVAVTVLGATADHLEDGELASSITEQLIGALGRASGEEEITLYLDALGNTGDPAALEVIQGYLDGSASLRAGAPRAVQNFGVSVSALTALRKIPGAGAEDVLVATLSTTNDEVSDDPDLFALRELAAAVLSARDGLSAGALAALEEHRIAALALPGGYYTYNWNRHLGGSTVGVNLPGMLAIATPPGYRPYLYARQSADAHIWSFTRNLIYGDLLARSTASAFEFRAYMHIGGGLIKREVNYNLPCSYNGGGNLYNTNITVFNVTISVPIFWAITVNFNIRGSGYFSLDWSYNHNVCSLTSGNFTGRIIPTVWARAEASAYLDIVIARGGGTLGADLLRTSLPVRGSVNYANAQVSFCINVSAQTQALSGSFKVWGDLRVPRFGIPPWKWSRVVEKTLWTFGTPANTYVLYDRCF